MGDLPQSDEVILSPLVERTITLICKERNQDPPSPEVRQQLAAVGEEQAFEVVRGILNSPGPVKNLSSLISYRIRPHTTAASSGGDSRGSGYSAAAPLSSPHSSGGTVSFSTSYPPPPSAPSTHQVSAAVACCAPLSTVANASFSSAGVCPLPLLPTAFPDDGEGSSSRARRIGSFPSSFSGDVGSSTVSRRLPFNEEDFGLRTNSSRTNCLLLILKPLEFRRLFLLLSYIGRRKLEDILSPDDAHSIATMKNVPMPEFESLIWSKYGNRFLKAEDRRQYAQWDSGKTHLYYCDVFQDGSFSLKGPCLTTTRTHLQRSLGDDNVLIVKFIDENLGYANMVSRDGILVGLKRYHFFVFKDESKGDKKKDRNKNDIEPASKNVKCYFVKLDSIGLFATCEDRPFPLCNVGEARCRFMHIHMVSSMAKYMARFSLILSKTIKFPVDISTVVIEIIEDIPCRDENGSIVYGEEGKMHIQTDGTGFISEDLARLCPQNFGNAKYIKDKEFQKFCDVIGLPDISSGAHGSEAFNQEPPLLMQCRLFQKGLAVKGTLLLNLKLRRTIQVRHSMVKIENDDHPMMLPVQTFDSLELVAVSNKPKRNYLSKNLIALLSYGGVPRNFFLELLASALYDTLLVFSDKRAALKVSVLYGEMDDDYTAAKMICAGVPLDEPYLKNQLHKLAKIERTHLKNGKLPIGESFYLMGTTDPTGVLNSNEVCVILENGPISGKVLVYRNPGLHFGDIHVMEAVYVKDLEDIIGNSKYAIFFSTKGKRSAAAEMGNGDFDGDMYWVSRNPQLVKHFRVSDPWKRICTTPSSVSKRPSDYSSEGLEAELFQQFLKTRKPSHSMASASNSWTSFMDQLLMEKDYMKKEDLKRKMLKLIDIYYDAIDAPKSGKKIDVPPHLMAYDFPHHMGKNPGHSYKSTSILGEMYDRIQHFDSEGPPNEGIWKIPFFDQCLQTHSLESFLNLWKKRYTDYRREMANALRTGTKDSKNTNADDVWRKYKLMLYEAEEFIESKKDSMQIYKEALAIYHLSYDFAISRNEGSKCCFAWKVAGSALCKYLALNQNETQFLILLSVLVDIL